MRLLTMPHCSRNAPNPTAQMASAATDVAAPVAHKQAGARRENGGREGNGLGRKDAHVVPFRNHGHDNDHGQNDERGENKEHVARNLQGQGRRDAAVAQKRERPRTHEAEAHDKSRYGMSFANPHALPCQNPNNRLHCIRFSWMRRRETACWAKLRCCSYTAFPQSAALLMAPFSGGL